MEKLAGFVFLKEATKDKIEDDDFADRLSYRVTVTLLVGFAIFLTAGLLFGKPMVCWTPAHFHGSHHKFTESYCWIRNTYYLPFPDEVPKGNDDTERQTIYYYQWVPLILLLQATLFYAPTAVWHIMNSKAGVDCDDILKNAHSLSEGKDDDEREKKMNLLVNQIRRFLGVRRSKYDEAKGTSKCCTCPPRCCGCFGKRLGNYLTLLFLFTKILFIANVITQFFWLNRILSFNFNLFGFDFFGHNMWVENHDWTETANVAFPRVTICDLDVRRLGNVHSYAVQCTLPVNLFHEKIYLFLWFWFCFVAAISIFSLFTWLARAMCSSDRVRFVKNHLHRSDILKSDRERALMGEFVREHLRMDGVFIMRLIAQNVDGLTVTEIMKELWEEWIESMDAPNKSIEDDDSETSFVKPSYDDKDGIYPKVSTENEIDNHPKDTHYPHVSTEDNLDDHPKAMNG